MAVFCITFGWFDRQAARIVHDLLVSPWVWVTGRSSLSLTWALWRLTWVAIVISAILATIDAATDSVVLIGILGFLVGAQLSLFLGVQFFFTLDVREWVDEVVRCVSLGGITPQLMAFARGHSISRQIHLVFGISLLILRHPFCVSLLFMALERYTLTDVKWGGGKPVWTRTRERLGQIQPTPAPT